MDLNQLADLGEFIGGIAVIVTLAYLGVQVRQSARLTRAATAFSTTLAFNDTHATVLSNPELAVLLLKAETGAELTPLEERMFHSFMRRIFNLWVGVGMAYVDGAVSELMITAMKADVVSTCERYPAMTRHVASALETNPGVRDLAIFELFVARQAHAACAG